MTFSNIHSTFNKVLNFFVEDVAPETIKFPKEEEEKEAIAKEFEKVGDQT